MIIAIVIIVVLFTAAGYAAGVARSARAHDERMNVVKAQLAKSYECYDEVSAVLYGMRTGRPFIVGTQPPPIGWPFKEDDHG